MFKIIYHVTNGPAVMYEIDARHALANFPEEWKGTEREVTTAAASDIGDGQRNSLVSAHEHLRRNTGNSEAP